MTFCVLLFLYLYIFMNIPHSFFRDRDVYIIYAEKSQDLYDAYGGMTVYANEPIFLKLNIFLSNFISSSNIVFIFLFFCLLGTLILLFKHSKNVFNFIMGMFLILFCHYAFHSQLVVLRQSISTIILLFFLTYTDNKKNIILVSFFCSFIHSSFFLITFLLILYYTIPIYSLKIKSLIIFLTSAFLGLFIKLIGGYLGIRQASEDHILSAVSVGGGAFLCFLIILIYFLFFIKEEKNNNIYQFSILGLSLFLGLYFINPAAGRLMSTFILPIIFVLCSKFNMANNILIFFLLILFFCLDVQGVMSGMSMNTDFHHLFKYIRMNIVP